MIALGRYQHYKGGFYQVLGVATHSEELQPYVLYHPLLEGQPTPELWIRPLQMFTETIELDGLQVPRFRKVADESH